LSFASAESFFFYFVGIAYRLFFSRSPPIAPPYSCISGPYRFRHLRLSSMDIFVSLLLPCPFSFNLFSPLRGTVVFPQKVRAPTPFLSWNFSLTAILCDFPLVPLPAPPFKGGAHKNLIRRTPGYFHFCNPSSSELLDPNYSRKKLLQPRYHCVIPFPSTIFFSSSLLWREDDFFSASPPIRPFYQFLRYPPLGFSFF